MRKYSDQYCVLVKKHRFLFHCIWVLEENGNRFRVHVGKELYAKIKIGEPLTIGRIGRKLINIRTGHSAIADQ